MNTERFLNLVAKNVFGTKAASDPGIPDKYYIGLSTTAPTINGGNVTEPSSGAGYARVELDHLTAQNGAVGVTTNAQAINFNESTSGWGTITHFVIFDALTGGNLLMYGALSTPRTVEAATIMTIKEGYLNLSVQNPA